MSYEYDISLHNCELTEGKGTTPKPPKLVVSYKFCFEHKRHRGNQGRC